MFWNEPNLYGATFLREPMQPALNVNPWLNVPRYMPYGIHPMMHQVPQMVNPFLQQQIPFNVLPQQQIPFGYVPQQQLPFHVLPQQQIPFNFAPKMHQPFFNYRPFGYI